LKDTRERIDWAALLAEEAKSKAVIRANELAKRCHLSLHSALISLKRQEHRGLVEHVVSGIYLNRLATGFSAKDVVNLIRPRSYISLDSALAEWGVSTQSPISLTCISTSHARTVRTRSILIDFRAVKNELFWGFVEKKTRYGTYQIAEPEKALLDWIYFRLNDGIPIHIEEFNLQSVNIGRLLQYAKKFPSSVFDTIISTVVERHLAAS
jgi:predicted transcriptional regulator of viral defense system